MNKQKAATSPLRTGDSRCADAVFTARPRVVIIPGESYRKAHRRINQRPHILCNACWRFPDAGRKREREAGGGVFTFFPISNKSDSSDCLQLLKGQQRKIELDGSQPHLLCTKSPIGKIFKRLKKDNLSSYFTQLLLTHCAQWCGNKYLKQPLKHRNNSPLKLKWYWRPPHRCSPWRLFYSTLPSEFYWGGKKIKENPARRCVAWSCDRRCFHRAHVVSPRRLGEAPRRPISLLFFLSKQPCKCHGCSQTHAEPRCIGTWIRLLAKRLLYGC